MKPQHTYLFHEPKSRNRRQSLCAFCAGVALLIAFLVMFYLSSLAMTQTVDMNTNNPAMENIDVRPDNYLKNLLFLAAFSGAALGWALLTDRLDHRWITAITSLVVVGLGLWFLISSQSSPTHDSWIVSNAAYKASLGDSSGLSGAYFQRFPFQLGYVLYSEILIRVLHTGDHFLAIEIVNLLCLAITYLALLSMVKRLYGNGRVLRITAFLMMVFLPPLLFCSFTYGNLPGLMFGVLAMQQLLGTNQKRGGWRRAVLAALCIGLAVALKKNMLILLVAMEIIALIRMVKKPSVASAVCMLLCILSVFGIPAGAQAQYEKRFDLDFGKGIPMSSWAAMGLSDAYIAPGWYSMEYTVGNFEAHEGDHDAAHEASVQVIKDRLEEFRKDPDRANAFFYEKIDSQWNEPSCQSIWTNQVRGHYREPGMLASWVCGKGESAVKGWMNAVLQLLYIMSGIGLLYLLREKRIEDALLPTCFLGGFFYHTIFEAKSQYALPYLILLLPLAAYGLSAIFSGVQRRERTVSRRIKPQKLIFFSVMTKKR